MNAEKESGPLEAKNDLIMGSYRGQEQTKWNLQIADKKTPVSQTHMSHKDVFYNKGKS